MKFLTSNLRACFGLLFLLPLISACGLSESELAESGATLTGAITHNGAPIEFAMVIVQSKDGSKSAIGKINDDGKYVVENCPIGEVLVGVNTDAGRGEFTSKMMQQNKTALDPKSSKRISTPKFVELPKKYFDPNTSGLSTTIQAGTNTYDIVCN